MMGGWLGGSCGELQFPRFFSFGPIVYLFIVSLQLCGWASWAINVYEEFRGRGIGKVLAKTILRQIAEMGYMNVVTIFEHNKHSRNLFEPLGLRLIGKTSLVYTKPIEDV